MARKKAGAVDGKKITKPCHMPDDAGIKRAELLAGLGLTQEHIALVLGISEVTLRKYYDSALKIGKANASARVAQTLYAQATNKDKPNISACIFWLKCQAGWKEAKPDDIGKKEQASQEADKLHKTSKFRPRLIK